MPRFLSEGKKSRGAVSLAVLAFFDPPLCRPLAAWWAPPAPRAGSAGPAGPAGLRNDCPMDRSRAALRTLFEPKSSAFCLKKPLLQQKEAQNFKSWLRTAPAPDGLWTCSRGARGSRGSGAALRVGFRGVACGPLPLPVDRPRASRPFFPSLYYLVESIRPNSCI